MRPIIFIAGMSRAGSMWTYNVVRLLLKASGYKPLPESIPVDDRIAIQESIKHGPGERGVFCFKTHRRVDPIAPDMKIICPYRDVRDAIYSYMKFMKCPFGRALMAGRAMMENTDYYLSMRSENILPLRYDEIVDRPENAVTMIAGFLQLSTNDSTTKKITATLSRKKIKKYLKQLDDVKIDERGNVRSEQQAARYAAVPRFDGSHRIYDYATGFQSNHITTGKEGEWKVHLSLDEQKAMLELTAPWLKRYGFSL